MARIDGSYEVSKTCKQKGSLMDDYFMLEELTTDLIQVLNKYAPKIGCKYTNTSDESQVLRTIDMVAKINQLNLDIIYPNRHKKN